jgi:type II secretory pathway pseudopilin PulG
MKNKYLAEKHVVLFYDDLHDPTKPTKENPNGELLLKFSKDNAEHYLFVDGSIVSNGGDYREMSSTHLPKKKMKLFLTSDDNNKPQLQIIDNRYSDDLNIEKNDYSIRSTFINIDGSSHIKFSDEQGFSESMSYDKEKTKEFLNNIVGINPSYIQEALNQKQKNELKKNTSLLAGFVKKLTTKKEPYSPKNNM